jgi:hypothetical protein
MYRALTDITVVAHLLFIAFVVGGSFLARRRRWIISIHIVALIWAVYAELSPGIICPLTTLENILALRAGLATYSDDFVARYLLPIVYQNGLSQSWQYCLVAIVLGLNTFGYLSIARSVPNQSSDSTPASGTSPAGQEPRHR